MSHIDLYWSFRSPYSYLALKPTLALLQEWDVQLTVKIVMPLAIRQPEFFVGRGPQWMAYLLRDIVRLAQMSEQTLAMPSPDPIVVDPKTGEFAPDQPHIWRLSRLGVTACMAGRGLAFINEVGALIWTGVPWDQGTHLADAVARAGLDLADLEAAIEADKMDAILAQNDKDLRAAGHWGVPTFVLDGEPFFGQDRIDVVKWRLQQLGVKKR